MDTFKQLKDVLCQSEVEILADNPSLSDEEYHDAVWDLDDKFEKAKTLLDLIHIYEKMGYETCDANEVVVNTMVKMKIN